MIIKVRVVSDRPNEYVGKKGYQKDQELTVMDVTPGEHRLTATYKYKMSGQEKERLAGKLQDKDIVLGVIDIRSFNGKSEFVGAILENPVDKPANGAK